MLVLRCPRILCKTLLFVVLVAAIPQSWSYRFFQDKIPNGNNVPHPCKANYMWAGVGHENTGGGGARNRFGQDFANAGNQWTRDLCLMDSDSDGKSNGEELGDPSCTWSEGGVPDRTTDITHPGVCEPFGSAQCAGQDSFVSCELDEFDCDTIKRPEVKSFDVSFPKTKVPAAETNYFCMKADMPSDGDYFVVGGEILLDNIDVMHHMTVYGCADEELPEGYDTPTQCLGTQLCSNLWIVWTVGVAGQCMPENTGFRFGTNGIKRLLIEIHWNNPRRLDTHWDASGMRVFYEPYRPDILEAGVTAVSRAEMIIPPGDPMVVHEGVCTSDCSRKWLNAPIQVFDLLHHMHYLGRRQVTTVSRAGGYEEVIMDDPAYSYDSPQVHRMSPTFEIRPGDHVVTRCEYSSLSRATWTYGGQGTQDEMCVVLLLYYPRSAVKTSNGCGSLGYTDFCLADWGNLTTISGCNVADISWFDGGKGKEMMDSLRANCNVDGFCRPECERVVRKIRAGACFKNGVFDMFGRFGTVPGLYEVAARMNSCPEKSCSIDDVINNWDDGEDVRDAGLTIPVNTAMVVSIASVVALFVMSHL